MVRSQSLPRIKVSGTSVTGFDIQTSTAQHLNNNNNNISSCSKPSVSSSTSSSSSVANSTSFVPSLASSSRLMFPRCANENDIGPVELARKESQHFIYNTEVIVSQRDETRQLSKELIAQAKDAADKLEKTQMALRAFYNTLGKMADNFGKSYSGNKEIGQELIRITARHKEACDILADVTTSFRRFSGLPSSSSRSNSPESSSTNSVLDRMSKQYQKECEVSRKENEELKKYLEDVGFKYGSSISSTRKSSSAKVKKMDANETNKYLSKCSKTKDLFISSLLQQRRFMCIFCSSLCHIVDNELRLSEKLSGCEGVYAKLVESIRQPDKLPENTINDIKLAGQVSSTDVIFKSSSSSNSNAANSFSLSRTQSTTANTNNFNSTNGINSNSSSNSEPQYDSISQTSSLGSSSTSLSTTASNDSPGGTSSSYADSGFVSSRESSHDDPDYRDPAIYFQSRLAAAGLPPQHQAGNFTGNSRMFGQMTPGSSQSTLFTAAPTPPPRRGSCCQSSSTSIPSLHSNSSISSLATSTTNSEMSTQKLSSSLRNNATRGDASSYFDNRKMNFTENEIRVTCNDIQQFTENVNAHIENNNLIRSFSMASATATLTNQTISQQRLSHPVLPTTMLSGSNNHRTASPVSPGSESISECYPTRSSTGCASDCSSTDIWVPRVMGGGRLRDEDATDSSRTISKSQSSSTDTLEANDSPRQYRKHPIQQIGVDGDSLNSSTDTLDGGTSPAISPEKLNTCNGYSYTYEESSSLAHNSTIVENSGSKSSTPISKVEFDVAATPVPTTIEEKGDSEWMAVAAAPSGVERQSSFTSSNNSSPEESSNEECFTTIKRSPKSFSTTTTGGGKAPSTNNNNALSIAASATGSDQEICGSTEEVSDFMKQLQQRRLNLNFVDKNTLPFWENAGQSGES